MDKEFRIETKCVQSGWKPKKGEPRILPIYQSTTFKYDTTEEMGRLFDLKDNGYFYTRCQNPTNDLVAAKIADLEGGVAGVLTSSGQAATFYAVFNICEAGDHVICASASLSLFSFPNQKTETAAAAASTPVTAIIINVFFFMAISFPVSIPYYTLSFRLFQ